MLMRLKNLGQLVAVSTFFWKDAFIFRFNLQKPKCFVQYQDDTSQWIIENMGITGLFKDASAGPVLLHRHPAGSLFTRWNNVRPSCCFALAAVDWTNKQISARQQAALQQRWGQTSPPRLQFQSGVKEPQCEPSRWLQKKKKKVFNLDFYVHYVRQTVCLCKYYHVIIVGGVDLALDWCFSSK